MKALVIGASGATGLSLTKQLLSDDRYDEVHVWVRRPLEMTDAKLHTHVVDYEKMSEWSDELTGDVLFSALGTTLKDAGSKEAQWKVDYTHQYDAARHAKANGVKCIVLVSAIGANTKSAFFYNRMKGQLDKDIAEIDYERTIIMRPPSLIRPGTTRLGERISVAILKALNVIGLLKNLAPMETELLAQKMIKMASTASPGVSILGPEDIRKA